MKTEIHKYLFILSLFVTCIVYSQTTVPFVKRYETQGINGDLTIIGNSSIGENSSLPYNGTTQNNFIDMVFIDIDNDASTFNSSTAGFSTNSCNRIVYGGLYWGAMSDSIISSPDQVKFKIPGGSYQDITADTDIDRMYYKDVTSLLNTTSNPSGNYSVANISTRQGVNNSAGWSLVIVYEDATESRKYITTFDGFSAVRNSPNNVVDFSYSGFVTPPAGPVEGRIGVAALEGDLGWSGDQMLFKSDANASFTAMHDAENDADNFFNSKITKDGVHVANRNVNSTNTLGWDQKLLNLTDLNPGNVLIGNNETGATVRVTNSAGGDHIYTFLNTFAVNIIEPVLEVLTSVEDTSNNQITHSSPVPLGATVWYNINFQNVGTDNAESTYILNVLPFNVILDESSIILPTGVTYSFNAVSRELRFDIDDSLVERGTLSTSHNIRYQVTASDQCFDYSDACTNLLENSILSYYDGETSGQNISGQPGYNGVNGCGLGNIGSMDLFVDTSSCSFDSELFFCNNQLTFTGDDGYDTYVWTDENGTVISNSKDVTVSGAGVYTATQRRTGCTETIRIVTVLGLDVTVTPIQALCKDSNGSVDIIVNEATSPYSYELYRGNTLVTSVIDKNSNEHSFTNLPIGDYSVRTTNGNGCFDVSNFTVTEPTLLVATSSLIEDVAICNGTIVNGSVQAFASGGIAPYEYSIDGGLNYQIEDIFSVSSEKTYEIIVKDANGCTMPTNVVVGFIPEIEYEISKEDIICVGDSDGRINVNVSNDQGHVITYSLDGVNYQSSPVFSGLSKGTYDLIVRKERGSNICESSNTINIDQIIYLELTAITDFSCDNGGGNVIIAQVDPIYQNEVTFHLDSNQSNTTGIFDNVSKGSHTVTVTHNDYGCTDDPVVLEVEEYTPIVFNIVNTDMNSYEVVASGGKSGYEYSIDSNDDFGSTNTLEIRESRDYLFFVRDAKGCVTEQTQYLEFLDIEIPDFFTPEGDGINDTWYPINIAIYPNITVSVFDRYQRIIGTYKGTQYSWDGNYKSKPLPSGDYWYVIKLNESSDNREFKGNFTLIR